MLWHWGRRGGGPRYTLELARALAARRDAGVEVHLSYSRQSDIADALAALPLPSLPVDTYTGPLSAALATARLPAIRSAFARYLVQNRVDTVFCTMSHLWNVATVSIVRRAGARYVLALHDALPHPGEESAVRRWATTREIAAADGIITLSEHVRERLIEAHGYPRSRTWVLPHGVFDFGPGAARRLDPDRPVRLFFFGRLLPYKGIDILLDAHERLRRRFGARIELTILGSGDLSPHAGILARLEGVRVENRWVAEEEIHGALSSADLLVLPYREASQSGVAPTAFGMGIPVVATPVGGLVEQVADGVTGRIAATVTAEAVEEAIASLIDDPELYARCSSGALDFARDRLSWGAIADGYVAIANEMCGLTS